MANAREQLIQAMLRLLQKYSYEKLTTQKILDEAKVSRSTFYRYYRDKFDLLNDYYQFRVEKMHQECKDWKECTERIFLFVSENRPYFRRALNMTDPNSFWEFLYRYSYEYGKRCFLSYTGQEELSLEDEVGIEFYVSGSIHIMKEWLRRDDGVDPVRMADWSYGLIPEKYRKTLVPGMIEKNQQNQIVFSPDFRQMEQNRRFVSCYYV